MKTLNIYFFDSSRTKMVALKKLKKQIESLAQIAYKADATRYYLHFLQFEKLKNSIRISATNGHVLSDIIIDELFDTDLQVGAKVHIAAKALLKITEDFLKIEIEDKAKINNSIIAEVLKEGFPLLERVRINDKPPVTICFSAALLKKLADCLEGDVVEISFDPAFPTKAYLVNGKKSSGVIMPVNRF